MQFLGNVCMIPIKICNSMQFLFTYTTFFRMCHLKVSETLKLTFYRELQRLQDVLGFDDHFYVLGFPCNQFGGQEPGDEAVIDEFARSNYAVDFPMFSKVEVQGDNIHPVWQHLIDESNISPEWNFYKYLINHEGKVVQVYPPRISVNEAFDDIIKLVKKARLVSKQKTKTVKKDLKDEL